MKMFKSFLQFLVEAKTTKSQKNTKTKPKDAKQEPHEVLTAILCCRSFITNEKQYNYKKYLNIIKSSEPIENRRSAAISLLQSMKNYAEGESQVIGLTNSSINEIASESNIENLVQAISAAEQIHSHGYPTGSNVVYLAGNSADDSISNFFGIDNLMKNYKIDSFGMKDFNSSDIVLISDDNRLLGVSLKKVKSGAAEPTMINRSLSDALSDPKLQKQFNDSLDICFSFILKNNLNAISQSFTKTIVDSIQSNIKKQNNRTIYASYLGDEILSIIENKKSSDKDKLNGLKSAFVKLQDKLDSNNEKLFDPTLWKNILSKSTGFWIDNLKDIFRNIINTELKNNGFKDIIHNLFQDVNLNNKIASELVSVIFKCSLNNGKSGSVSTNGLDYLKKYNFDFALCLGEGKVTAKDIKIDTGRYYNIQKTTSLINHLIKKYSKPSLIVDQVKEDKSDGTYKPFFKLVLMSKSGKEKMELANIEVRYKGEYKSSPQFQATMAEQFEKYFEITEIE